jgi:hypothetical protein
LTPHAADGAIRDNPRGDACESGVRFIADARSFSSSIV